MADPVSIVASVLTAVGIGGAFGAFFQARFQQRAQISQHEHEEKHSRYRCTLILMQAKMYPKAGLPKLREIRRDIQTQEDLDNELGVELLTGIIFADNAVLEALGEFIQKPTQEAFIKTAVVMRNDLWGSKRRKKVDLASVLSKSLAHCPAYSGIAEQPLSADIPLDSYKKAQAVSDTISVALRRR